VKFSVGWAVCCKDEATGLRGPLSVHYGRHFLAALGETEVKRAPDRHVLIGSLGPATPNGVEVLMDRIFSVPAAKLNPPGLGGYFEQFHWPTSTQSSCYVAINTEDRKY
jgi:hypothetical protein